MFKLETIENFLYFDVETVCSEKNLLTLQRKNPRLAELWKKRAIYYRGANPEISHWSDGDVYLAKASLEPEFSKIVCVSFGSFSNGEKVFKSFYGTDEIEILEKSNKVFNNAMAKNWKLCGHNIKGFDVPCLGKRMVYNGINPSMNLQVWDKKPWEIPYIDTSDVFAFGSWTQQKYLSLDLLSCSLGVKSPKENMDGSKVNEYFWNNQAYEEIKDYCEIDVRTVMEVLEKVCF